MEGRKEAEEISAASKQQDSLVIPIFVAFLRCFLFGSFLLNLAPRPPRSLAFFVFATTHWPIYAGWWQRGRISHELGASNGARQLLVAASHSHARVWLLLFCC